MAENVWYGWKAGQLACVLFSFDPRELPKWYFAEIVRVNHGRRLDDMTVDAYLHPVPETYPVEEGAELLKDLFPTLSMSRELVMLARLCAGWIPKEEGRYGRAVRMRVSDLCRAEPEHFLDRLTGGGSFSGRMAIL